MHSLRHGSTAAIMAAAFYGSPLAAQEPSTGHISIELNALEPVEDACRISFVIRNGHETDIEKAVYEAVLFDSQGRVDRLTLVDFGSLPADKPRVRQFVVPGIGCTTLGRILINGAETCSGEGVEAALCTTDLQLTSRTDIEVMG